MKRTIRLLALILTLTLALSAAAMAENINYDAGEKNATGSVSAVSLVDGCTVAFEGEKLKVTYTNANFKDGDMAVVFLLETRSEDGKLVEEVKTTDDAKTLIAPTTENIKYLDQGVAKATASNGSVTFYVYPQNHTSALVRIISVNKAGKLTDVNVAAVKLNYTLGDVDGSGEVTATDALRVLQFVTNRNDKDGKFNLQVPQAGDVDKSGEITATDALRILQFITHRKDQAYWLGQ